MTFPLLLSFFPLSVPSSLSPCCASPSFYYSIFTVCCFLALVVVLVVIVGHFSFFYEKIEEIGLDIVEKRRLMEQVCLVSSVETESLKILCF